MPQLRKKIEQLPDKLKRREIVRVLRAASRDTVKVARELAPKDTGVGAKSIRFQALRRSRNPGGIVGPRSRGKYDGFHLRQFVIPGHNIYRVGFRRNRRGNQTANARGALRRVAAQPFMDKAFQITQGRVSQESEARMTRFIQKQIDRL